MSNQISKFDENLWAEKPFYWIINVVFWIFGSDFSPHNWLVTKKIS